MNKDFVICGFSGVGKSTAGETYRNVVDLESSSFSKIYENGEVVGNNPDFPSNYVDKLCSLMANHNEETHYYLLSCHEEVRKELQKRGIKYLIVLPYSNEKNEYIKRWFKRGSSIEFITNMEAKWYRMMRTCNEDEAPKLFLEPNEYISDLFTSIK